MSQGSSLWNETMSPHRFRLMPVPEHSPFADSKQSPVQVDARKFHPISVDTGRVLGQNTSIPRPPSPYYAPPTTPFLPPDTPQLNQGSTPPPVTSALVESTPRAKQMQQLVSTDGSPVKTADLFHGLGSIWTATPNELSIAHNRGRSEIAQISMKNLSDDARPRSRSEIPSKSPIYGFDDADFEPDSSTISKRNSYELSSGHVSEIAAPSPLRQHPVLNAMAQDMAGRDTPGGVALPKDLGSPSPDYLSSTKAANAKALADFIKSGAADEGPLDNHFSSGGHNTKFGFARRGDMPGPGSHLHHGMFQPKAIAAPTIAPPDPLVQYWKNKGGPTWADLAQNLAFVDRTRAAIPTNYGVIKLTDIPYNTVKPEVVALIGERAPMVHMPRGAGTYAIHIIMERTTAKSNDAYVEFETPEAAQQVVARLETHTRPMIQTRRVKINVSSQEALMRDMFPRSKCVRWEGSQPVIQQSTDAFSVGFQGFVSSEELVMTVKVAQNPSRSRFALKHQQRTYESMISLMFKYPWYAVQTYTICERDLIFKAVRDQLITLTEKLRRFGSAPPVDGALLQELLDAGLNCPGFSESQRAHLIDAVAGRALARAYVTPIAHYWPFEVLGRKDGLSDELVSVYISILRTGSVPAVTSLAQMSVMNGNGDMHLQNPHFGNFQIPWPKNKNEMTMADAAKLEWDTLEQALRKVVRN